MGANSIELESQTGLHSLVKDKSSFCSRCPSSTLDELASW
jgi:hypothetical protein